MSKRGKAPTIADAINIIPQREALCKWLRSFSWDFFVTLTFRLPVNERTALKHARRLLLYMANELETWVWSFMAVEWFKSGESVHLHALVGTNVETEYRPFWQWWNEHYGISWWRMYDKRKGAGWYVTKYIWKEQCQLGWWDFFTEKLKKRLDK